MKRRLSNEAAVPQACCGAGEVIPGDECGGGGGSSPAESEPFRQGTVAPSAEDRGDHSNEPNCEEQSLPEAPRRLPLRLQAVSTHPTGWHPSLARPVLNVVMDAAIVEAPPPAGARVSYSHVVVLDDFISETVRLELLDAISAPGWDHTAGPPDDKWERGTCDGAGLPPTWGLKAHVLDSLMTSNLPAVLEVHSRLCLLYPEYDIVHLPSSVIQQSQIAESTSVGEGNATSGWSSHAGEQSSSEAPCARGRGAAPPTYSDSRALDGAEAPPWTGRPAFDCCPILANAAVAGDAFQWHVDADPASLPPSAWTNTFGDYCNGDPGKPLLVSLVLYLDADWPRSFDAETLFMDTTDDVGVIVRPKRLRAVLMDQDVLHRLSPPSREAGRPRYSLVWKLAFLQRNRENTAACSIARAEWGRPTPIGSAARFEQLKRQVARPPGGLPHSGLGEQAQGKPS